MENEPIELSVNEFENFQLSKLKRGECVSVSVWEDLPENVIWREKENIVVEVNEHIYTKFWVHKFHALVFAEAMLRALKRLRAEGHPFSLGEIQNDDDPHIFISWKLFFQKTITPSQLIENTRMAFDLVWARANSILENSDSVLLLGKDTGVGLKLLKKIQANLEDYGYYVILIKEQPDKLGESIIQKVLRYALSSKFVIIENSVPSGHLYEIPHVAKMAECVTVLLQEKGKGATWVFEDGYFKNNAWKKFSYSKATLDIELKKAVSWAENFSRKFALYQKSALPWMKNAKPHV